MDLAELALGLLETGQVEARNGTVSIVAVVNGRGGRASVTDPDEDGLARAVRKAVLQAKRATAWPVPPLPPASTTRGTVSGRDQGAWPLDPGLRWATWHRVEDAVAIASTTGVRAEETRAFGHGTITAGDAVRAISVAVTSAGGTGSDPVGEAVSSALALSGAGPATPLAPHVPTAMVTAPDGALVLGPDALAHLLLAVRSTFGVDLALDPSRVGERIAAPGVDIADAPALSTFDAEGTERQRVALVEDGILRRGVHDAASAAQAGTHSTGHSTLALTLAPQANGLTVEGGTSESIDDLIDHAQNGLYVPALVRNGQRLETRGAAAIAGGRLIGGVADGPLRRDAALTAIRAMTVARRTVPIGDGAFLLPAVLIG
ncbi:MAG: hypothetical protein QOF76_1721 [Solirubrobacteraceae bacterium]|nr:hypothetical protein [Solirubrobacteraceae bacterium]